MRSELSDQPRLDPSGVSLHGSLKSSVARLDATHLCAIREHCAAERFTAEAREYKWLTAGNIKA